MEETNSLSELDRMTLMGLLARYNTLFLHNKKREDLKKDLDRQIAESVDAMQRLRSTMKIYGFDTETGDWKRLRLAIGSERYLDALNIGRLEVGLPVLDREPILQAFAQHDQEELATKGQALLPNASISADEMLEPESDTGTVREIVVELMKASGPEGRKASWLRSQIEARRGSPLHEKTIGMTLYRLSQDGLVERRGITWYWKENSEAVPQAGVFE